MGKMISSREAADKLGLSIDRVQQFCRQRRIKGARLIGRSWFVPDDFTVARGARGPKPKSEQQG